MPVLHLRCKEDIVRPFPPAQTFDSVFRTIVRENIPTELITLPAGFLGDITPERWRKLNDYASFIVHAITDNEADVIALTDKNKIPHTSPTIEDLRRLSPHVHDTAHLRTDQAPYAMAISLQTHDVSVVGGAILCASPIHAVQLRQVFPEGKI